MAAAASISSIVLFLAFATAGLQKILFNPVMSRAAEHFGFTKSGYQRIGMAELLGALGVLVGLAAAKSSVWGVANELAAGAIALTMALALNLHRRAGDEAKAMTPALLLGVLALVELVLRLAQ